MMRATLAAFLAAALLLCFGCTELQKLDEQLDSALLGKAKPLPQGALASGTVASQPAANATNEDQLPPAPPSESGWNGGGSGGAGSGTSAAGSAGSGSSQPGGGTSEAEEMPPPPPG